MRSELFNHVTPSLSSLERAMISHIPPGGNWQDIPSGMSARVDQIRERAKTRGLIHTTYYGRLRWDAPAYTISTFYSRSGNGCFIHPNQDRLLSHREAARLQSFPDNFVFTGPQRAIAAQVGNAIPPLLALALANSLPGDRVVDLFAGAGGLSYGLELGGKKTLLAIECDEHAANTYELNHPHVQVERWTLGPASTLEALVQQVGDMGGCDLVVGGPPCQSFSTAGKRSNDARSTLVGVFVDAVRALRPTAFIMENVLGLRSFMQGQVLAQALEDLYKAGYDAEVWDLRAEQFGVPQRRRRLVVAGTLGGRLRQPHRVAPVHNKGDHAFLTVESAIQDLPPLEVGEGESPISVELEGTSDMYQLWARGLADASDYLADLEVRVQAKASSGTLGI